MDAEGNGSFADPGDLVATALVQGLYPTLQLKEQDLLLEFRYQPVHWASSSRVDVQIETRGTKADDFWETNVIDWLER